jgi:hypothetical protein
VSAKWPEIEALLLAKWPLTMIFEKHMDPGAISYSQFRRQVQRRQIAQNATPARTNTAQPATLISQPTERRKPHVGFSGYDPTIADPDKIGRLIGPSKKPD